jgi:hypothetical protein
MPLRTSTQGVQTEMVEHTVDARWLMAYAGQLERSKPTFYGHHRVHSWLTRFSQFA